MSRARIDPREFRERPLRVHAVLHDVPLEDVWAIRLRGGGAGRTIQDVRAAFVAGVGAAPPLIKALFRLRRTRTADLTVSKGWNA